MQKFLNGNYILFLILILAASLRFYGLDWDQGHYLHPDERAIIMFTTSLHLPQTFEEFLDPLSPLNPHFFAYGNFPLYLLKITSSLIGNINIDFSSYTKMYLIGRTISALADIGTILVLFLIGKRIGGKSLGIFASFFYTLAVFPIQASHFFAVDILLTFFIISTLYRLLIFYEKPSAKNAVFVGICFGLSLVTKISATVLLISILTTIAADFFLIISRKPHKFKEWFPYIPIFLKRLIQDGFVIGVATVITFSLLQPYAIIDFQEFLKQNLLQSKMTHDAYTFPYTLQYVGKIPYFYELKNVFIWGLGPALAALSFLGTIKFSFQLISKHLGWWQAEHLRSHDSSEVNKKWAEELILLIFFWAYFITIGKFAVGWMRYMLPLYPLFCLFAAVLFLRILAFFPPSYRIILSTLYLILILIWPLSFMQIYTKPHTRIQATKWIQNNIPAGSTLAVEHWDDRLPLSGSEQYRFVEMTLYVQPDDEKKWQVLNEKLSQTDYIILSSNKLYVPLPKLTDCTKYKLCYPKTAEYYKNLFNGSLGFQKVTEFTSSPEIPILNIPIDDQSADESFTVYDHPKVIIFKNE